MKLLTKNISTNEKFEPEMTVTVVIPVEKYLVNSKLPIEKHQEFVGKAFLDVLIQDVNS